MPFSTNAPFNERGHAEQLRDIEYLYLKIQELFRATGINDGDLNPGGGQGVSQQVADDAWGSAPESGTGLTSADQGGFSGVYGTLASPVAISGLLQIPWATEVDSFGGWNGSFYIVPRNGLYLVSMSATSTESPRTNSGMGCFADVYPASGGSIARCVNQSANLGAGLTREYGAGFCVPVYLQAGNPVAWSVNAPAGTMFSRGGIVLVRGD